MDGGYDNFGTPNAKIHPSNKRSADVMLNKLVGDDSLEIFKDSSVIGAMTERDIMKNTNISSRSREPNMLLFVLTVKDVGNMKVQEIKQALRSRGISQKGLKKELSTRLVVAVHENVEVFSENKIQKMSKILLWDTKKMEKDVQISLQEKNCVKTYHVE